MIAVRVATVEDASTVAALNAIVHDLHVAERPDHFATPDVDALETWFRDVLGRPDHRAFLALDGDDAVGYTLAVAHRRPGHVLVRPHAFVELDQIAVRPDARRCGAGRALVDAVRSFATEVDIGEVALTVWDFNDGARRFFESAGFRPVMHRLSSR